MQKIAIVDENNCNIASILKPYLSLMEKKSKVIRATDLDTVRIWMKEDLSYDLLALVMDKETWLHAAMECRYDLVCFLGGRKKIASMALPDTHVVVNEDDMDIYHLQSFASMVTYGLNHRSTITASSIQDETITCCIQREFCALNGLAVEPQEFPVKKAFEEDVYEILAVSAIMLHIDPHWIQHFIALAH